MSTLATWLSAHIVLVAKLAFVVMVMSIGETTKVPLKLWLVGYGVLCILDSIFEFFQFRLGKDGEYVLNPSAAKSIESAKSTLNVIWWITGSYWMYSGGKMLANDAPKLFWLTAILLSLNLVVAVTFLFVMACIISVVAVLFFVLVALTVALFKRKNEAIADVIMRLMRTIYRIMREPEEMNRRDDGETPEPSSGDDQPRRRQFRRVVVDN